MTDDARIAKLTEMARRVWPDREVMCEAHGGGLFTMEVLRSTDDTHDLDFAAYHPRALDALEAALCALAGEPPPWAVRLAEQWRNEAHRYAYGDLLEVTDELLAAAKGET
jgi:hypothetical protein